MGPQTRIEVGKASFQIDELYQWLARNDADGAIVTFTGKVRNHNLGDNVNALTLEHYPGMTEKVLVEIVASARARWAVSRVVIVHRIGMMFPGEGIVFIGAAGTHRSMAFAAVEFIMDKLKTSVPFWKREMTEDGEHWVDAQERDRQAAQRWQDNS